MHATDGAETPNSIDSDHVPVTDTIPPTVPTVDTDLTGKATTLTPITVTTDPNTRVDLIDEKWAYYRYWHNRRKWSCHHYSYNSNCRR